MTDLDLMRPITTLAGPLAGRRALVVDDDEDVVEIARLILTHGGAAQVTARRLPEEAISLLASAPFKEAGRNLHAMGFDAVMVEPVDPFDLMAVVAAITGGR